MALVQYDGVLIKRGYLDTDAHTERPHVMERQRQVMLLGAEEQWMVSSLQSQRERMEPGLHLPPEGTNPGDTLIVAPSLQNHAKTNFRCLSPQPQETNAVRVAKSSSRNYWIYKAFSDLLSLTDSDEEFESSLLKV